MRLGAEKCFGAVLGLDASVAILPDTPRLSLPNSGAARWQCQCAASAGINRARIGLVR